MSITYKNGRTYTINYLRIKLPTDFEKQYPKGQARKGEKGWSCPTKGCCSH